MHCRSCNTRIGGGDRHCPNCGIAVNPGPASAAPKNLRRDLKLPLSRSTAIDPEEVELDQVSEAEPPTSASKTASASQGSAPRPTARASGGGFRPEPADVRRILGERPALLESGLRAYKDGKGVKVGAGYPTEVGEIDLLALDDAGALVVVMVADSGSEKDIVAGMLERIGWVRKHLGSRSQDVRGIALVEPHVQDLSYAAAAVAGTVDFKTYRVALSFDSLEV